jgi:hypothetical protein
VLFEHRWDEELVGAGRIWAFSDSFDMNRDPLGLEATLDDLGLDPGLRQEHRHQVFRHALIMSPHSPGSGANDGQAPLRLPAWPALLASIQDVNERRSPLTPFAYLELGRLLFFADPSAF